MPSVDVKTAVGTAVGYLQYFKDQISQNLEDVRLEEVELSEDGKYWLITLGYTVPSLSADNEITRILLLENKIRTRRDYKIFKVNSETNEVESMKIRAI